jgi:alpha-tubulin suppressor-like RCC1 family protein
MNRKLPDPQRSPFFSEVRFLLVVVAVGAGLLAPISANAQPLIDQNDVKLKIGKAVGTSGLEISWEGLPYHYYFMEHTPGLDAPITWSYLPFFRDGADGSMAYGVDPTAPMYFYRLQIGNHPEQEPLSLDFSGLGFTNWDFVRQGINPFDPQATLLRRIVIEAWPTASEVDAAGLLEDEVRIRMLSPSGFAMPSGQLSLVVESGPFELLDDTGTGQPSLTLATDPTGRVAASVRLSDFYEGVGSLRVTAGLDVEAPSVLLPISVLAGAAPAAAEASSVVQTGANTATVSWLASTDSAGSPLRYEVLRDGAAVATTQTLHFADSLPGGWGQALYSVVAIDWSGARSAASPLAVLTALPSSGLAQPGAISVVANRGHTATLTWPHAAAALGVAGYHIVLDGSVVATSPDNRWTFTNLQPAQTYTVTVRTVDQAGSASVDSPPLVFTTATAPALELRGGASFGFSFEPAGQLWSFGANSFFTLGALYPVDTIGTGAIETRPVAASFYPAVVDLAAGQTSSIVLDDQGTVSQFGVVRVAAGSESVQMYRFPDLDGMSVSAIGAGSLHFMAVDSVSGGVSAWGVNPERQLGFSTGTDFETLTPAPVVLGSGLPLTGVAAVSGGNDFSVALMGDGTLRTWGLKLRLGRPDTTGNSNDWDHPGAVIKDGLPISGVVSIAAGSEHTLALTGNGQVWSFGRNEFGQLGHLSGSQAGPLGLDRLVPFRVLRLDILNPLPLVDIVEVAAGLGHSLALDSHGDVWSWGNNNFGQLGIQPTPNQFIVAQKVTALDAATIVGISSGAFSNYAYEADGTRWAWGRNDQGQLGDGTTVDRFLPVRMQTGSAHLVFTPYRATPAGNGGVFLSDSRLGSTLRYTLDGSVASDISPVASPGTALVAAPGTVIRARAYEGSIALGEEQLWRMPTVLSGAVGDGFVAHVDANGSLAVWGRASDFLPGDATGVGQNLGDLANVPVRTVELAEASAQALTYDGRFFGWGDNAEGQLYFGGASRLSAPTLEPRLAGRYASQAALASSGADALGAAHRLIRAGSVWGAGLDDQGQLAQAVLPTGERSFGLLTLPNTRHPIERVFAGNGVSFLQDTMGQTLVWGALERSGLSQVERMRRDSSLPATGERMAVSSLVQISSSPDASFGLRSDGTVWVWGLVASTEGLSQLIGVRQIESEITLGGELVPLTDVIEIAAVERHTLALKMDGTVWAWGTSGEPGVGVPGHPEGAARAIPGLTGIHWIAAGDSFSMAGNAAGLVWGWGRNTYGELGDPNLGWGAITPQLITIPVPVPTTPPSGGSNPSILPIPPYSPPALAVPDGDPVLGPAIIIEAPSDLFALPATP